MRRWMVVVVAAVSLAAAAGCEDDSHYPPGGGGGAGGGGSGQIDAGAADAGDSDAGGDAGPALTGELCDVSDLRDPLNCPSGVNLLGIEVSAVGADATDETNADGEFRLNGTFPDDQLLSIGGDNTRRALVKVSNWRLGTVQAPRVSQVVWEDLIADIGSNEPDDTASIALYLISIQNEGQPAVGVTVSTVSDTVIFYDDDASVTGWNPLGATGTAGAVLILSVPPEDSAEIMVDGIPITVPVQPNHLTFAREPV